MTKEEILIAKQSMELYAIFMETPGQTQQIKTFYQGAATGINDLLCRLVHGDEVRELAKRLQRDDG